MSSSLLLPRALRVMHDSCFQSWNMGRNTRNRSSAQFVGPFYVAAHGELAVDVERETCLCNKKGVHWRRDVSVPRFDRDKAPSCW